MARDHLEVKTPSLQQQAVPAAVPVLLPSKATQAGQRRSRPKEVTKSHPEVDFLRCWPDFPKESCFRDSKGTQAGPVQTYPKPKPKPKPKPNTEVKLMEA